MPCGGESITTRDETLGAAVGGINLLGVPTRSRVSSYPYSPDQSTMARPGSTLVDAGLATELRDDHAYHLTRINRRRAHGLGVIQPYVLRRH